MMSKRLRCVSVVLVGAMGCGTPPRSTPDGAPELPDAASDAGQQACAGTGIQRGSALAGFAPFAQAQTKWSTLMAAASKGAGAPPYPAMQSAADPLTTELWK